MSVPEIRRHPDEASLAGDLASALLARLEESQARGEVPQISLTGGSIADAVHREVARRVAESGVDWSRVVFWWGDERFVPSASPDRNATQARVALLDQIGAPPANIREIPASDEVATAEDSAAAYSRRMREEGSGAFEVVILGVGPDGHVASLFPDHPALSVQDQIAVAVHDSPKPPPNRVSLTLEALGHARAVWFVVSGEAKADAVARALAPDGSVSETPARGVHGQAETVWWLDEAAASSLT